jgi:hypothetical protein
VRSTSRGDDEEETAMGFSAGQKSERVLRFLRGLSRPRVSAALAAAHGFSQAHWDEGWELLRAATGRRLTRALPVADSGAAAIVDELDAWENRWFPLAQATLRRHHPAVAHKVFLNLSQTSGIQVVITVSTFVERIRALAAGDADSQAALALLKGRGLTDSVLAQAEGMLKELRTVQPTTQPIDIEEAAHAAHRRHAQEALWAWYREWSTIARNVIRDGNMLRMLGFLTPNGRGDDDDVPGVDDTTVPELPPTRTPKQLPAAGPPLTRGGD